MQLNSVHLENFRAHRDRLFEFGSGLTVIVGPNGSGKTTALEAFVWSLYGTTAARGKADSILPVSGNGKPKVTSVFTLGEHVWTVVRDLKNATISNETTEVATSLKGVTAYIEELLGMTREEFLSCVMATQKEMAWLKGKSGPDRQRFISKIRGHDVFRRAQQLSRELERKYKGVVEGVVSAITGDEVTQEQIDQALVDSNSAAANAETAIIKQKQAGDELDQATKAMAGEKKLSDAHSTLVAALSTAETRHKDAQGALVRAEEAVAALPEPGDLEALEAALQELDSESQGLDGCIVDATLIVKETTGQLMVAEAALEASTKDWKRIEALGPDTPCDACGQSMDPAVHEGHLDKLKLTIIGEREARRGRQGFAEEAEAELEVWVTRNTAHTKKLDAAKGACTIEQAALQTRDRLEKDVAMAIEPLKSRQAELVGATDGLQLSTYDPSQYEKLTKHHKKVSEALLIVVNISLASNKDANAASFRHTRLVDAKAAQEAAKKKIAKAQEDTAIYGAVDDVFSGLRNSLNDSLRPMLSAMATEIVAETTGGRFDALELDESYTPQLYADGVQLPVISGGEEDIVSLALRIAVGQLIASNSGSPIGMLVMDEPFGSLDEERQRLVMDMLAKLCEKRFNQIIVITHTMGIRDGADHIIELSAPSLEDAGAEMVAA